MKANATLTFHRQEDASITSEWKGGTRIEISTALLTELCPHRLRQDQVIHIMEYDLRLLHLAVGQSRGSYTDTWIAMRDGRLARFYAWYVRQAHKAAFRLFAWEWKWIFGHKDMPDGFDIPKWSLTGLLLRPTL